MPLQTVIPGGPELWRILFISILIPLPVALWIYWTASRRGDNHALAWALGAFLAGMGSSGFGSFVVGFLYYHVRDRQQSAE